MEDEDRSGGDPREDLDELFDLHVTGAFEAVVEAAPERGPDDLPVSPGEPVQTTEWFNVEDFLAMEDDVAALPRREHHVTAVVISHDGDVWLPAVLTTLAAQTRLPDAAVGVDTGSVDASADLLSTSFGVDRTVRLEHRVGFGAAVRAGLDRLEPRVREPFAPDVVSWVWLLHDDSAPTGGV